MTDNLSSDDGVRRAFYALTKAVSVADAAARQGRLLDWSGESIPTAAPLPAPARVLAVVGLVEQVLADLANRHPATLSNCEAELQACLTDQRPYLARIASLAREEMGAAAMQVKTAAELCPDCGQPFAMLVRGYCVTGVLPCREHSCREKGREE